MLTLKQCQNLKGWGLPQNKSGSYYRDDGKLFYCNEVGLIWADKEDQFACPDLEQLLEFAATKWPSIGVSRYNEKWYATGHEISYEDKYADPDLKQAIYKLLEQIIEPNNKVEESKDG